MQLGDTVRMSTEDQRQQLITYAQQLGMPPEALKAAIAKRKRTDGSPCQRFADLDEYQANEMIRNMIRKLDGCDEIPF